MRLAEAIGAEEVIARVRIWWYPFSLREWWRRPVVVVRIQR